MSARDDYPILVKWLNGGKLVGFEGDQMEIAVAAALREIDSLREDAKVHKAFYDLTVAQRNLAWYELSQWKSAAL